MRCAKGLRFWCLKKTQAYLGGTSRLSESIQDPRSWCRSPLRIAHLRFEKPAVILAHLERVREDRSRSKRASLTQSERPDTTRVPGIVRTSFHIRRRCSAESMYGVEDEFNQVDT